MGAPEKLVEEDPSDAAGGREARSMAVEPAIAAAAAPVATAPVAALPENTPIIARIEAVAGEDKAQTLEEQLGMQVENKSFDPEIENMATAPLDGEGGSEGIDAAKEDVAKDALEVPAADSLDSATKANSEDEKPLKEVFGGSEPGSPGS
eukprot:10735888-Alexandrium_andersonii.AAC.1